MFGVAVINIINGTLLSLTPMILKQQDLCNLWLIGIYLSLNSILLYFGSSSYNIVKFVSKIPYDLITKLYLFLPFSLMILLLYTKSYFFLILYFILFSLLQICRNISLNNVTMLSKDNINLVKKRDQIATITSIFGLLVGQFLLDIHINLFLIYLFVFIVVAEFYFIVNKVKVEQKTFEHTKVKHEVFDKFGFLLGLDKGVSLIIITVLNYFVIISTNEYGYFKVVQAVITIFVIQYLSKIITSHKDNINFLINLRTFLLIIPIIIVILLSKLEITNLYLLFIIIMTFCLSGSGEGVFLNIIFNRIDHKNAAKHTMLFSSYYKTCTIFLIISIFIIKLIDFNNILCLTLFITICSIILTINNYYLKKSIKYLKNRNS